MNVLARRGIVGIGVIVLGATLASRLSFDPAGSVRPGAPPSVRPSAFSAERGVAAIERAGPAPATDPVATYIAMRDDVNPKPRLQWIDGWARTAEAGADSDLLGMALVDPDASVRARAQELFDRRMQLH